MKKIHFPYKLDKDLWYEKQCQDDGVWHKHYLLGSRQTFPGLVEAYCTAQDSFTSVSLEEMEHISPKAEIWMQGFLAGAIPPYPKDQSGNYLDDSDPIMTDFMKRLKKYFKTGFFTIALGKKRKDAPKETLKIFLYHEFDAENWVHKVRQITEDGYDIGWIDIFKDGNIHLYDACPNGFHELEWVDKPDEHEGLQKALELAKK